MTDVFNEVVIMFSFSRIDPKAERDELIAFLTGNSWPFHVYAALTAERVDEAIEEGAYQSEERDSYWIDHESLGRVGLVKLEDLEDPTPLFDLRLADAFRGRGLAVPLLGEFTTWVFNLLPNISRIEGQTREDNVAMRKAFVRSGWVKEAHYRETWPVEGSATLASVAYAVLRRDWERGETTPVPWEDDQSWN